MGLEPCRHHPNGHLDEARRISDTTILAWTVYGWDGYVGKWMAFALQTGRSDNVVYPTKLAAMQHSLNEKHYMYLNMHPGGMTVCEAHIMLTLHRRARSRDIMTPRLDLPHGGRDIIPRIAREDIHAQLRALMKGR
jgi:hypothetical protein